MNNRQNGRRRGRGGPQQLRGPGGNADRGNRIDNRARGNAAQLLEKYKNLARDAQMQGDRVLTEYYHQFADHYFRVLSESRSRFEDQQRPQRQEQSDEEFGDEADYQDEGERYEIPRPQQQFRQRDEPRLDRQRPQQQERQQVQPEQRAPVEAEARQDGDDAMGDDRRPRRRRGRRPEAESDGEPAPRIEMDRLPPAFADREPAEPPREAEVAADEEAPKRRRTRRPKDGDSVAA